MDFRITGLSPELFQPFYGLSDVELAWHGAVRVLSEPRTAYIHAHYAKPGCFAARIDRV